MNMINMSAKEPNYCFETNARLAEKIVAAFRKYFTQNSEMILASLAVMNGNVPYQHFELLRKN